MGKTVALAHGVFDLLHLGHVRHIEAAAREGDILILTITADRFVNKGPGRPVFTEQLRAEMLAALEFVDWVAINPHPSAEDMLRAVAPDVYVKGSEYASATDDVTGKIIAEREAVEAGGGRVVFTDDVTFSSPP
jgi:rfaE bifunctional protein nucleotidyltransferase chain/domain